MKIHEQVFITMRTYCTFVSTFFIPKMFVKWSRFYVITCFSVSMLSRSLIAQLTFFGVFNWNIRGSNSFSPIITIKSLRRRKKCIQCLELIYAMAGLTINALKGKDGCSSKRSRGRNINGQVVPGLTMNPPFLGE